MSVKQLLLDVVPGPAPTLDNFVVGANDEAFAALQHLERGRAIYLWGPAGCGRTHLLKAATATPGTLYLHPGSALNHFETAISGIASRVAIDDLHRMDADRQASVFALYNQWRESAATEHAMSLVVAGDRPPASMALREDLRTRLGWDLVFRLELLSDDDKLAALDTHATNRGLQLVPDMLLWMLNHYDRDMGRLILLLDALDRYSLATKRPITTALLRTVVAQLPPPPAAGAGNPS